MISNDYRYKMLTYLLRNNIKVTKQTKKKKTRGLGLRRVQTHADLDT